MTDTITTTPASPPTSGAAPMSELDTGVSVRRGRKPSRRQILVIVGVAAVAVIAAAVWMNRSSGDASTSGGKALSTAKVTTATLIERDTVSGSLEFGDSAELNSLTSGTVTYTPAESTTLKRGSVLWKVDQNPTRLMYGKVPAYREMKKGDEGDDVRQLEENLSRLGYGGFDVDGDYTSSTADAVAQWHEDIGLDDTGKVTLGQVAFSPGPVRVATIKAARGALVQGGAPVLTVTSTEREVSLDLGTKDQSLASKGAAVVVTLPDGTKADGKITTIGTVAASSSTESSGGVGGSTTTSSTESTIPVTVTLDDPGQARKWDSAPVDVELESDRAENVLTVPVTALVVLAEGGYAVEVSDGSSTHLAAVKTGLFADGRVEVSGQGIAEGTTVVVPTS